MTSIDPTALAFVTGGTAQAAVQTSTQAPTPDGGSTQPGGSFLSGIQQFLSFLQSPQFGQLVGGIQSLISSFASAGAGAGGAGGTQAAPPTQPSGAAG